MNEDATFLMTYGTYNFVSNRLPLNRLGFGVLILKPCGFLRRTDVNGGGGLTISTGKS